MSPRFRWKDYGKQGILAVYTRYKILIWKLRDGHYNSLLLTYRRPIYQSESIGCVGAQVKSKNTNWWSGSLDTLCAVDFLEPVGVADPKDRGMRVGTPAGGSKSCAFHEIAI